MPYRLPSFVSGTLASQPSAPRQVTLKSVAGAVLAGFDCIVYLVGAVLLGAIGWQAEVNPTATAEWLGPALLIGASALLLLVAYRIWSLRRALQTGHAELAEVTQVKNGMPRWYGSPWGDVASARYGGPTAAKGTYRLVNSGETGRYYVQQSWALALSAGDRIWVLRLGGRDVPYAPTSPGASQ